MCCVRQLGNRMYACENGLQDRFTRCRTQRIGRNIRWSADQKNRNIRNARTRKTQQTQRIELIACIVFRIHALRISVFDCVASRASVGLYVLRTTAWKPHVGVGL